MGKSLTINHFKASLSMKEGQIVSIKKHPKFARGQSVKIVKILPFNCMKISGYLNKTEYDFTFYAHKNELYIPRMTKEDWNDIANGRD